MTLMAMIRRNHPLLLLPVLWLVAIVAVEMQAADMVLSRDAKDFIVNVHNEERSEVTPGAANMRKIVWDSQLEEIAKKWVKSCNYRTRAEERNLGTNYYFANNPNSTSETPKDQFVQTAVGHWTDSRKDFIYSIDCGEACPYVQIINAFTDKIGCAINSCSSNESSEEGQTLFFVCFYSVPDANGFFPYQIGPPCSECASGWNCFDRLCVKGNNTSTEQGSNQETDVRNIGVEVQSPWQGQVSRQLAVHRQSQAGRAVQATDQTQPMPSTQNNEIDQPNGRDNSETQHELFKQIPQIPSSGPGGPGSGFETQMFERHPPSRENRVPEQQISISQDQYPSLNGGNIKERRVLPNYGRGRYNQNTIQYPDLVQRPIERRYPASSRGQYPSIVPVINEARHPSYAQGNYQGQDLSLVQGNNKRRHSSSSMQPKNRGQFPTIVQGNYRRRHPSSMQRADKGQFQAVAQSNYKVQAYPLPMRGIYNVQYQSSVQDNPIRQYPSSVQVSYEGYYPSSVEINSKRQYPSFAVKGTHNGQHPSSVQGGHKRQHPSTGQRNYRSQNVLYGVPGYYREQIPVISQTFFTRQYPTFYRGDSYKTQYPTFPLDYYKEQYPVYPQTYYREQYPTFAQNYYSRTQYPLLHQGYYRGRRHQSSYNGQQLMNPQVLPAALPNSIQGQTASGKVNQLYYVVPPPVNKQPSSSYYYAGENTIRY